MINIKNNNIHQTEDEYIFYWGFNLINNLELFTHDMKKQHQYYKYDLEKPDKNKYVALEDC